MAEGGEEEEFEGGAVGEVDFDQAGDTLKAFYGSGKCLGWYGGILGGRLPTDFFERSIDDLDNSGFIDKADFAFAAATAGNAGTLDGLDSAAFAQLGGSNDFTGSTTFSAGSLTVGANAAFTFQRPVNSTGDGTDFVLNGQDATPAALPSPNFLLTWGDFGADPGQFIFPSNVAVDSDGNVYVADTNNNRIQKFNSGGQHLLTWSGSTEGGPFSSPQGVAVDSDGNVYVADTANNRIQKFQINDDGSVTRLTLWDGSGATGGGFDFPQGVAVDGVGNVYVADSNNNRIQKFSSSGSAPAAGGSLLLRAGLGAAGGANGVVTLDGNTNVTGNLTVGGAITGNLTGTADNATNAANAALFNGKDTTKFFTIDVHDTDLVNGIIDQADFATDAGNASTADNALALGGTPASGYSLGGHNHDDSYFTETELGSTGDGGGSTLIGLTDFGNNFAPNITTVEEALAELAASSGDFLPLDGTLPLTGNWNAGTNTTITASDFVSTATTGTPPFVVASIDRVVNFNADLLDGMEATDFAPTSHTHTDDNLSANVALQNGNNDFSGINSFSGTGLSLGGDAAFALQRSLRSSGAGTALAINGQDAADTGSPLNGGNLDLNPGAGTNGGLSGSINLNGDTVVGGALLVGGPLLAPSGITSGPTLVDGPLIVTGGVKLVSTIIVSPDPFGSRTDNGLILLAAMSNLSGNTSATPYLLKIEPGTYDLGSSRLSVPDYVDIEGSGKGITTITSNNNVGATVLIFQSNHTELRHLTVENTGGHIAIEIDNSNVTVFDVNASSTGGTSADNTAIYIHTLSEANLCKVSASAIGSTPIGILIDSSINVNTLSTVEILDSDIFAQSSGTVAIGVLVQESSGSGQNIARFIQVEVTATGGSSTNTGLEVAGAIVSFKDGEATGSGGTTAIGVAITTSELGSSIDIINSRIEGDTFSISHNNETVNVIFSQLVPDIIAIINHDVTQTNCYDFAFIPLTNKTPPEPM